MKLVITSWEMFSNSMKVSWITLKRSKSKFPLT